MLIHCVSPMIDQWGTISSFLQHIYGQFAWRLLLNFLEISPQMDGHSMIHLLSTWISNESSMVPASKLFSHLPTKMNLIPAIWNIVKKPSGWWLSHPSENMKVNWDDDIPNRWENKKCNQTTNQPWSRERTLHIFGTGEFWRSKVAPRVPFDPHRSHGHLGRWSWQHGSVLLMVLYWLRYSTFVSVEVN